MPTVSCSATAERASLRRSVSDDGVGFPGRQSFRDRYRTSFKKGGTFDEVPRCARARTTFGASMGSRWMIRSNARSAGPPRSGISFTGHLRRAVPRAGRKSKTAPARNPPPDARSPWPTARHLTAPEGSAAATNARVAIGGVRPNWTTDPLRGRLCEDARRPALWRRAKGNSPRFSHSKSSARSVLWVARSRGSLLRVCPSALDHDADA